MAGGRGEELLSGVAGVDGRAGTPLEFVHGHDVLEILSQRNFAFCAQSLL